MPDLVGKTAIVTGAAQGIGAGIARVLARCGADVAVNDLDLSTGADQVCQEIRAMGRKAIPVQADVTDSQAVKQMIADVEGAWGKIDILVNNAGHNPAHNLLEYSEDDWEWVLNLNLKAYFRCAKAVLSGMLVRGSGRIINIASISGQRGGFSCDVDYAAAKAGILGFTRTLARWAAPRGILVNAVSPGYIETKMRGGEITPLIAHLIAETPLKRRGRPEEIGEVVAFLAGPGATFIVGEVINVNGGAHIA